MHLLGTIFHGGLVNLLLLGQHSDACGSGSVFMVIEEHFSRLWTAVQCC